MTQFDEETKAGVVEFLQSYCMEELHALREGNYEGDPVLRVSMQELNIAMPDLHDDAISIPDDVFEGLFVDILNNFEELADDFATRPGIEANVKPVKKPTPDYELPSGIRVAPSDPTEQVRFDIGEPRGDRLKEKPLVAVEGICQQKSDPTPRPLEIHWICQNCGTESIVPTGRKWDLDELTPNQCKGCERQGPWGRDQENEPYEEYQQVRVQEPPEEAQNASNPREMLVDIFGDSLIDSCNPGDRVTVTGLLKPDESSDSILVDTRVNSRDIKVEGETFEDLSLSEEERDRIQELAARDDLFELFQNTIAPSIHGHRDEKLALALQMFGGVTRHNYGNRKRGQIHILMIGDPGVGKSQLMNSAAKHAPRSVKTVGKGASAAGLTATAVKEKIGDSEEWTLKAGELVLGDKGLVAIDELDKMRDEDESALHEALADGTVSVSKADIHATLNARCSALMVANPDGGRFDPEASLAGQFNLPDALLSRCDLIFPFEDVPNEDLDEAVVDTILESTWGSDTHEAVADGGSHIVDDNGVIPEDLFAKYVAYARRNFEPTGTSVKQKIKDFYLRIRGLGNEDQISITPRMVPAIRRLSEASARARLSSSVEDEDVERAIGLVMESLNQTIYEEDEGYNVDRIETGSPSKAQEDRIDTVLSVVRTLYDDPDTPSTLGPIKDLCEEKGVDRDLVEDEIEKLRKKGEVYEGSPGKYIPTETE